MMWRHKSKEEFWKWRWEGKAAEQMDKGWDKGPCKLPNEKLIAGYVKAYGVMLDAGAGSGRFVPYFLDAVDKYVCVDYSQAMCTLARQKHKGVEKVEVYRADIEKMQFPDDMFDVTLMVAVLRHLPRPKIPKVCTELLRVTKSHLWVQLLIANSPKVVDWNWGNPHLVNHLFLPEQLLEWFKQEPTEVYTLKTHPMDAKQA